MLEELEKACGYVVDGWRFSLADVNDESNREKIEGMAEKINIPPPELKTFLYLKAYAAARYKTLDVVPSRSDVADLSGIPEDALKRFEEQQARRLTTLESASDSSLQRGHAASIFPWESRRARLEDLQDDAGDSRDGE
jgi:hypothetical protein